MYKNEWEISPHQRLLDLEFKKIWLHRHLLHQLIIRDILAFYKQTVLGPLWFFIQPAITTLIFTLVFGNFAKVSTQGLPKPLFYLAGVVTWSYFSECFNKTSSVFRENAYIFGKVYFPRIIVPIGIVISVLLRFCIQFSLFLICIGIYYALGYRFAFNWAVSLLPVLILLMALQGLGMGIFISALTVKYRDLTFLMPFMLQMLMYSTTVIYPLSTTPDHLKWMVQINPMTAVIETFRYAFLGKGTFSWIALGYSAASTAGLLVIGLIAFQKTEKTFIDTI